MRSTYLIGSLRNPELPLVAEALRKAGVEVFDDWHASGPHADDAWREYEQRRGHDYPQALQGLFAEHTFQFDLAHLKRCDSATLVLPAGKSAHLELGWMLGQGKPGWVLVDTPDRWDVMYKFATGVFTHMDKLVTAVGEWAHPLFTLPVPPTMIDLDRLRARAQASKMEPVCCFICGSLVVGGGLDHSRCRA